jgi:hypothetical protein
MSAHGVVEINIAEAASIMASWYINEIIPIIVKM